MIRTDHRKIERNLRDKGWEEHFISRTVHIFSSPKTDTTLYLLTMLVAVIGSIILLTGFVPILIEMPLHITVLIVFVGGMSFGLFLDHLLRELNIDSRHYAIAFLVILTATSAGFMLVLHFARQQLKSQGVFIGANPLLIITFYMVALAVPHLFYKARETYGSS